jgi:hypothetical protein
VAVDVTCCGRCRTGDTSSRFRSSSFFDYRRSLLGTLCRIIARALTQAYDAALPRASPGLILFVQTFVDLVNSIALPEGAE